MQQKIDSALTSTLAETIQEAVPADHDVIPEQRRETPERPRILIAGGSRHLIVDRAEEIMATRCDLFSNSGRLVRVAEAKDIGEDEDGKTKGGQRNFTDPRRILMDSVAKEWLTTELTRDIEFVKSSGGKKSDGYTNRDAPDWLAPALIEHKGWPNIRELAGITSSPILRGDGSVRIEAGYDPETRMLLIPCGREDSAMDSSNCNSSCLISILQFLSATDRLITTTVCKIGLDGARGHECSCRARAS